ncbi:nitroreductase/quinone reductase family protein [Umezawaea endophytica]|uniref:Nitroreductase/quinone reductase family protein n=1 Tax=Umezawaea endophytica TaxID=1654476 RepID=A0A9X3AHM8_9PSEU|nr:nitroreductase/quinone reductase family protein [Umezawaea endophytica]MCS7479610.1 nitroreductase/quinone reductase family protein [Umezawaea endophytica]
MSFTTAIIDEFRANNGRVTHFPDGDLLLLTTTGTKTGTDHTVPLGYVHHGDHLLVIASNAGSDHHPDWYHNVLANPAVRVELGTDTFTAIATPAQGAHRDDLFDHVTRTAPGYADHQRRTTRTLPVLVLTRTAAVTTFADKLVEVHTWLREQIREIQAEAGAPAGLKPQLRQHCLTFCEALTFHHTSEDDHVFPGIATHHTHLADTLDQLREEHKTVARIKNDLLALLADRNTTGFRTELDRLAGELNTHLDREEHWLLPVLADIPWPPAG